MCLYPALYKNPKYKKNSINKGKIPKMKDQRVGLVPVGCGKCIECRKQRAREWQVRLHEEIRERRDGKFVTLSFTDESLVNIEEGHGLNNEANKHEPIRGLEGYELENQIATVAMRRFLERWRDRFGNSVRHWALTELGQKNTERIHIHGIFFTDDVEDLKELWKYGRVYIGEYVNGRTINYIVKYLSKQDELHPEYVPKMLVSPGIGDGYFKRKDAEINRYRGKDTVDTYRLPNGTKMKLPTYYRRKLWKDWEREKLWLYLLDKEERWVMGRRVDISEGEDIYWETLKDAREKNRRWKYGDNSINWDRKLYERRRRMIKKLDRIRRVKFGE